MKAISLFSGIGGIDLAMSIAGFDIVAQVEINEYCRKVLTHHAKDYWSNATQFSDVRDFGRANITGSIDLIAGGFPCQPFSIAGARKGKDDNRNMWEEFRRIISEFRPRAVLLENVPAICAAYVDADGNRKPAYGLRVVADLTALGYDAQWGIIAAAEAGAMHERKRWFCVAYLSHTNGERLQASGTGGTGGDVQYTASEGLERRIGQELRVNQSTESGGRESGLLSKRGVGVTIDGLPRWLAEHRRVAPPLTPQYEWEPNRTIPVKTPNHKEEVQAIGNAVFVPVVFSLCMGIRSALQG